MNLVDTMYGLTPDECWHEARAQFAMAEIVGVAWVASLHERGGWFALLRWAEMTYTAPYCAKLAGPCPDGCEGHPVLCGKPGELHGDCWRVKPPPIGGVQEVDAPSLTDAQIYDLWVLNGGSLNGNNYVAFARAVLAATTVHKSEPSTLLNGAGEPAATHYVNEHGEAEQLYDCEGITLESNKPFAFKCCDCGLTHHMVIVSEDGKPVGFAVKRVTPAGVNTPDGEQR